MVETFLDGRVSLYLGDCLEQVERIADNSIDALITDAPYHLESIVKRFGNPNSAPAQGRAFQGAFAGFHGKTWDDGDIAFRSETWAKFLRVLKPGAHIAVFTGEKTIGKQQAAIEAAGFETRSAMLDIVDSDARVADFIASLNDAQRCAFLRCIVEAPDAGGLLAWVFASGMHMRKPLGKWIDKRVLGAWASAEELERGALSHIAAFYAGRDIDLKPAFEPIIIARKPLDGTIVENLLAWGTGTVGLDDCKVDGGDKLRFPTTVMHDGSKAATFGFPGDETGSAARFFMNGKADADDRAGSKHPTIKPISPLRHLVKLLTTPGQTILDPFAGSGTLAEAAFYEGRRAALIEREAEYQDDIRRRMALCLAGPEERRRESIKAKTRNDAPPALPLFSER